MTQKQPEMEKSSSREKTVKEDASMKKEEKAQL